MVEGSFPYFQNYKYQPNETDPSNQRYSSYQDYQPMKTQENKDISQKINVNNKNENHKNSNNSNKPKNIKNTNLKKNIKKKEKSPPKKNDSYLYEQMNQRSTNKIDYRYVKKCPIKDMISTYKNEDTESNIKDRKSFLSKPSSSFSNIRSVRLKKKIS